MKKLFLIVAALSAFAFAQNEIQVGIGPYHALVRDGTWAVSGIGGVQNFYYFTPRYQPTGLCLYVQNNDTAAHTFGVALYTRGNSQFASVNTANWSQTDIRNQGDGSLVFTVAASGALSFSLPSVSSPLVAVEIKNSGGVGTATIALAESQGGIGCSSALLLGFRTAVGFSPLPICDRGATGTVAAGVTTKIITTTPSLATMICAVSLSVSTAVTVQGPYTFRLGTGATCGTGPLDFWSGSLPGTVGTNFAANGGVGLLGPPTASDICLINGAGDGVIRYNVSYLQISQLP